MRDRADKLFMEKASDLLKDPWDARNAYIKVVLENRPKIGPFFNAHGRKLKKRPARTGTEAPGDAAQPYAHVHELRLVL